MGQFIVSSGSVVQMPPRVSFNLKKCISLFSGVTKPQGYSYPLPQFWNNPDTLWCLAAALWTDPWGSQCPRLSITVGFPAGSWPVLTIPPVQPPMRVYMGTCVCEWVGMFKRV